MKFTLSWLKDHLKTKATVEEISTKLSAIGLEVESVEDPAAKLGAFRVARIVEAKRHPNADKLQVVQVEVEKGQPLFEVVCGAPNARAGMISVFAPLGTYIPGSKITLEKKPVRGVVSNGMMCSAAELELAEDSEGILDLPAELAEQVGARYIDVAGLNDPVFEVKLTPNRPDCTGVRGIARDLAAAGLGTLKDEKTISGVEGSFDNPVAVKLDFANGTEDACPVFAARLVKGVSNGPSPEWLQNRLKAVGLRPINALVDVTNYISQDRGRPLHVYDADKLKGAVRARLGKGGETFQGLDGKEHTVDETMCVIADDSGPLGLGGIIGGEASGSTETTTNVLIESAYFDPLRTAATGRKTGLVTDARYRFERGVDPESVLPGLDLATQMILKLCGGKPSKATVAGRVPDTKRAIVFELARVEKLSGLSLPADEIKTILETLGCVLVGGGETLEVTPPSWRPDIHGSADLVEEVVRIAGIDRVPATALPRMSGVSRAVLTDKQKRARRARRLLAARGLVEAVTWSFLPKDQADAFGTGATLVELANPISVDLAVMRPSLLPGLLTAVERNRNRGFADVALFELGQAYRGDKPEDQYLAAAGVRAGTAGVSGGGRHWDSKAQAVSVFDAKADAAAVLAALGIDAGKAQVTRDAPAWYHPGRSGTLRLGPKTVLAHFGELHPRTLAGLDVEGPVVGFEVFLDALPPEKKKGRAKAPFAQSDLLPVRRDFAFVLDRGVNAGDVVRAALGADKALISGVSVFDVFEGGALAAEGKKSVAIEVTLQPTSETLTDKDIEAISQKVIADVKKATGGEIRS
ncbi:phenylalanine--tRNA ligase subunit beta [Hyphomicrobium sp. DMF-1]|uniref:phenylalanine--tRNA ligase subunit beta n=1 Tax=Hyphomicrobium sp. DMF-1 TaxID=3019544 RepID=UPI0022EBC0FB|nr:phenylalanine--tRNA ligase subunit beta [Hyphomicrobium sp. DMF-1]WBT38938.1 phenylalanine--tRNA ligase subunit beta [Hyphomicrobium sp. DMF-1]